MTKYDIIGDVHGRSTELKELLEELGYELIDNVYKHPEGRQAIFIGDLINKGPDSKGVIDIVRPMVEAGAAQAIIGNHELNIIAMGTKKSDGNYILPRNETTLRINSGFINDYPLDTPEYEDVMEWFKSLPLYLDLPDFRVVHACWDDEAIAALDYFLEDDNSLGARAMQAYADFDKDFIKALKATIIGPFYKLDDDMVFEDYNGVVTQHARILWWASPEKPMNEVIDLQGKPLDPDWAKKLEMRDKLRMDFMKSAKPTFIGHYYLKGPARELSRDVFGVDYQDQLTAYRWNGSNSGDNNEFVVISAKPR